MFSNKLSKQMVGINLRVEPTQYAWNGHKVRHNNGFIRDITFFNTYKV